MVARCALLLQLAEQLDRGQDQSVIEARLVKERRALRLRLRGDDRLAVWSLERRLVRGRLPARVRPPPRRHFLSAARSSSHSAA